MKHTIKNSLAALLLLAMGVMGCSKDNTPPENHDNTGIPMSITVTDEGYTDSDPTTRTSELDYTTQFSSGDKIGVYVVKNGAIVNDNVEFTYDGSKWTGDIPYYIGKEAKYFAYYPYNKDQKSTNLNLGANTATEFFDSIISAWTPSTDQSDYPKYKANDLMIGKATATKEDNRFSLALNMTHAMAMVVMELPSKIYQFSNNTNIPDHNIAARNNTFHDFKPYETAFGTYRILVKPNQSGAKNLVGSYDPFTGGRREYRMIQNSIKAATYEKYIVDGGVKKINHNLQAGDFYLKDGSLVSKDNTLSNDEKAACIGIVYWVGNPTLYDNTLKKDKPECVRGLVIALREDPYDIRWHNNSSVYVQGWLNSYQPGKFQSVSSGKGDTDPMNNIQGYNNTKAIVVYNNSNPNSPVNTVNSVITYRNKYPAPAKSSDWYLPSIKELALACGSYSYNIWYRGCGGTAIRDVINGQVNKVGGKPLNYALGYYWSSTESNLDVTEVYTMDFEQSKVHSSPRDRVLWQRFTLAF